MTEFRSFKPGEILSDTERAKLSPEDRKRYDLEQKLRKLMKVADDSGATDDERAQATRTIAKLITKYQIELDLLMDKSDAKGPIKIVRVEFDVSNRYGLGSQRAYALQLAVVSPLGGKLVYTSYRSTKMSTKCEIFLPEDVVDFAKVLMASLMLQVETGMKVATVQHQRELRMDWRVSQSRENTLVAQFRKGYLRAWGAVVGRRMAQGREEARQEASASSGKEIVLRDTSALAQAAMDELYPKVRTARSVIVSETGRTAGARDGRRAQLGSNEVGGSRTSLSA